ncbi:MAG: glycoside hydrolase family 43 protein [Tannerellaceae bacterium]|jgi:alpha-N-arabinofuranosidase|nr:glycoside hydrolase family 43 protein [Tannerellaceae bacterium]
MKNVFTAICLFLFALPVNGQYKVETLGIPADYYSNPVITGMNPDPSICRAGDDFYLVTSTFEYFPGLPIYHSKDLVHWKLIGHALSTPRSNPLIGCDDSRGGQYAPTIRYHEGTFYVIGTKYEGEGPEGIFYVSAKNPAGPWSDPVWIGEMYVDPSLEFYDGKVYLVCPDNRNPENEGAFLLGVIDLETGKFTEPLRKIATGLGGSSPEGPHLYKIDGFYYLMTAEGGTGYQHREVIQRSRSPWGPYETSPHNPFLTNMNIPEHPFQAIGHADLIQLKDGSWWAVSLGIRPRNGRFQHLGRETFLIPVLRDESGWPLTNTGGVVQEKYPVPNLPPHPWEKEPVRDDFSSATLNLQWNFIRNPYAKDWSLTEKPGYLRLKGSALNLSEKNSPAFVGRRQTAFDVVASAKVGFTPVAEGEEAGLVVRANGKNHYDLLITRQEGKRVVMFRKVVREKVVHTAYTDIPDGDLILRISATDREYKFWIQPEGARPELLGTASTRDVSNERVYGFTGVYIGMYASGNGKANTHPADFDWFDFEEDPPLFYKWAL